MVATIAHGGGGGTDDGDCIAVPDTVDTNDDGGSDVVMKMTDVPAC